WSMQISQDGCRPTTVTSRVSSTSVTMAPSRLTTTRARISPLSSEPRGRGKRRLQLVVDTLDALDAARHLVCGAGLGLRIDDAHQLRHAIGALHHETRLRGAFVAAQGGAYRPRLGEVLGLADRFGRFLEALLLHHARHFLDAFVDR